MKAVELREMMLNELKGRESELIEELIQYKMRLAIKRLDNPLKVREAKRELARVKTIINEKEKNERPVSGA